MDQNPLDEANLPPTLPATLERNARQFPQATAYREKEFGIWQTWTWAESLRDSRELALGLIEIGIAPGHFVAIVGRNRPQLYQALLATQMTGAVPVPLYQDSVAEDLAYVLDHCGASTVIAGDQEQVDKILEVGERLPAIRHIIYLDPRGMRRYEMGHLHAYAAVKARGRAAANDMVAELDRRISTLSGDDTCVILYTSGTTGRPKGVVLSHRNIIVSSANVARFDRLTRHDSVLAYLPMAWVGDFINSVGQAYVAGFSVNCPESARTMMNDLREIGPSYFFAPPRVFEAQLTNIMIRMEDAGWLKRTMFDHFMRHARKVGARILIGQPVSTWDRIRYTLGDVLVYGPLKDTLGYARIRVGYTAGEAIGPEIFDFYRSLGINLKQLYGQTEASVFITVQPDDGVHPDTVGIPAPGVELRIDDSGEVQYRSPGGFREYYRNEEATRETRSTDGWVSTGDAGFIDDSSGQLRIIDRAKDVGKTANGALFAPKYVENKLKFYPDILEAVVFGRDRECCTAIINIDLNAVSNRAERNNIAFAGYQELAAHPHVMELIQSHIEATNKALAGDPMLAGCQIHRFVILHKELDADDGELTRTRKVRRRIIEEKYADIVAALHDGSESVSTTTEVTYEDGRKGSISATLEVRAARVVPPARVALAA